MSRRALAFAHLFILLAAPLAAVEVKVPTVKPAALKGIPATSIIGVTAVPVVTAPSLAGQTLAERISFTSPVSAKLPVVELLPARIDAQNTVPKATAPKAVAVAAGQRIVESTAKDSRTNPEEASGLVFDGSIKTAAPGSTPPSVRGAPSVQGDRQLSGAALLADLHDRSGKGYRAHEYDEAKSFLFSSADQRVVDGKAGVTDAYSGIFVPGKAGDGGRYPEGGDRNHDGWVDEGMNVEHIWPQSFFDKRLPMRSDLHHLMATFIHPNGVRGNLPFGVVRGKGDYANDAGAKRGQGVFEPPDAVKGRVARSVLYFYARYYDRNISNGAFGDAFWNSKLDMLLDWNRRFPPDAWEKQRNSIVESFQGNRNPFIDDYTLADRVGVDGFLRRQKPHTYVKLPGDARPRRVPRRRHR